GRLKKGNNGRRSAPGHAGSRRRRSSLGKMIAGGFALAAVLALSVSIIVRDKEGNEVGRIKAPDGGSFTTSDGRKSSTAPAGQSPGWHGWPADAPKPAIAPFDAAQAK